MGRVWLFLIFYFVLSSVKHSDAYYIPLHRIKREGEVDLPKEDYNLPPTTGTFNPFPTGNSPFPGRSASNLGPDWPFSHQFSQGLDINPGNINSINGNLNIPIKEWGAVWDLKGTFNGGPTHTWYNYGHLLQPVNPYKISPSTFASWTQTKEFQDARANASMVPVAQLPGGWQPVNCKPPLCNPFVHTFDTAVQVMPPKAGAWFDGSLDFPIPQGPMGEGVRFPLSGGMFAGRQPINFNYGQHINPVDPFNNYNKGRKIKQPIGSNVPASNAPMYRPTDELDINKNQEANPWPPQSQQSQASAVSNGPTSDGKLPPGSVPLIPPPPLPSRS